MEHDPKIADLAQRFHNMTVGSSVTLQQAASAHFNCLANLALEEAKGDEQKAAKVLRGAMESLVMTVFQPQLRRKIIVHDGIIVKAGASNDH